MVPITKRLTAVVTVFGAAVALAGCGGGGSDEVDAGAGLEDIEPIELTFSDFISDTSNSGKARVFFTERVTELTEGKVTFDFYGSGTLHPPAEGLSGLQNGLTDLTLIPHGYFPSELPVSAWTDEVMAVGGRDLEYPNVNLAGMAAMLSVYEGNTPAAEEYAAQGIVPLFGLVQLPQVLHCTEPFETPEDLEGRSVRISNELQKQEMEALGMSGVFLPAPEIYEALQRGVLDCGFNPWANVLSLGLLDITPYSAFVASPYNYGTFYDTSKEVWDGLPEVVQDAFRQAALEAQTEFLRLDTDGYRDFVETVQATGHELIDPAQIDAALRETQDERPDVASKAPSGVSDPDAAVEQMQTTYDEVAAIVEEDVELPTDTGDTADYLAPFLAGSSSVDWDAYTQHVNEYLASN